MSACFRDVQVACAIQGQSGFHLEAYAELQLHAGSRAAITQNCTAAARVSRNDVWLRQRCGAVVGYTQQEKWKN
jgi:hypothetical protein